MAVKLNSVEIRAKSIEIAATAKDIGKVIHTHCMNIARFIASPEANGDVTTATHFLTLLMNKDKEGEKRSIVRADAVKNWLEAFAFVTWGKTKDGKEGFKLSRDRLNAAEPDHFKVAGGNPWNVYTKEKPFSIFDLDKAIAALVKRAAEKSSEVCPEGIHHKIDAAKLAALQELAK